MSVRPFLVLAALFGSILLYSPAQAQTADHRHGTTMSGPCIYGGIAGLIGGLSLGSAVASFLAAPPTTAGYAVITVLSSVSGCLLLSNVAEVTDISDRR